LRAKKVSDPAYSDIKIDDSPLMTTTLLNLHDEILKRKKLISSDIDIKIDQLATPDTVTDIASEDAEIEDKNDNTCPIYLPMPASYMSQINSASNEPQDAATTTFRGLLASLQGLPEAPPVTYLKVHFLISIQNVILIFYLCYDSCQTNLFVFVTNNGQ
jgi:hypothetical protein